MSVVCICLLTVLRSDHPDPLLACRLCHWTISSLKQGNFPALALFPQHSVHSQFMLSQWLGSHWRMVLPFTLYQEGVGAWVPEIRWIWPWVGTESASSGLVLEPYISRVNICPCFSAHSYIYMHVPIMPPWTYTQTHTHKICSLSFLSFYFYLLHCPRFLMEQWLFSYSFYSSWYLSLPYNVFQTHSSGPFALSFCLLFLLLLSRLFKAPPNRLSIGIRRLALVLQMLSNGNVQCFLSFSFYYRD